ncbi:hypothetical protein niasHT_004424 [Heterodera trifolii]|uniref:Macro domain-containing protein n=1 Tax=Heterodera trifolii TaxID=157864 RepID=A0ABD2LM07_9BILA
MSRRRFGRRRFGWRRFGGDVSAATLLPWQAVLAVCRRYIVQLSFIRANAFAPVVHQSSQFSRPFQKSRHIHAIRKLSRCNIQSVSAESFTICIGAQLKTMHNARILTCDQLLVDLLTVDRSNNTSNSNMNANSFIAWHCANNCDNNNSGISARTDNNNKSSNSTICHSQPLQLLMNLYRRDLACAVLIVVVDASDLLWHVKEHSKFAQLCEHSAELHFESLERQLKKIRIECNECEPQAAAAAVRQRLRRRQQQQNDCDSEKANEPPPLAGLQASAVEEASLPRLMLSTCNNDIVDDNSEFSHDLDGDHQYTVKGEDNDDYCGDVNSLRPGDVYVTNHSNLSAVQFVFHVVGDRQLVEQDISSRHPCINALRNVIRLAPHSGINHITFPLLLVEHMTETMTISWCLSRAELVFKCLKGFLMEVCSSGMSTVIAGVGGAIVDASGNAGGAPHFNINFVLPSAISPALFQQLVELFSSIFSFISSLAKCYTTAIIMRREEAFRDFFSFPAAKAAILCRSFTFVCTSPIEWLRLLKTFYF